MSAVPVCLLPTEVDTLTALSTFPPSYPYLNFNSDPNVCAFFTALNQVQQNRLNALNGLNLPIYVNLTGPLLDFVCVGLYGVQRPAYEGVAVDDDIYWRTVCWQHFKGDGFQYCERWLKRRVMRFLNECSNGGGPAPPTPPVSTTWDPTNYGEYIVLSAGNTVGTKGSASVGPNTGTPYTVYSAETHSSGRVMYELSIYSISGDRQGNSDFVGVYCTSSPYNGFQISEIGNIFVAGDVIRTFNAYPLTPDTTTHGWCSEFTDAAATGTLGVYLDFEGSPGNLLVWVSINGFFESGASPTAGTNPTYTFDGVTGTAYDVYLSGSINGDVMTLISGPTAY